MHRTVVEGSAARSRARARAAGNRLLGEIFLERDGPDDAAVRIAAVLWRLRAGGTTIRGHAPADVPGAPSRSSSG